MSDHGTKPRADPLLLITVESGDTTNELSDMVFSIPLRQLVDVVGDRVESRGVVGVNEGLSALGNRLHIGQCHLHVPNDRVPTLGSERQKRRCLLRFFTLRVSELGNLVLTTENIVAEEVVLREVLLNLKEIIVNRRSNCWLRGRYIRHSRIVFFLHSNRI